jgi:N-acetyl-alpha-D-glucosaminyl L-malate synthase BshA
VRPLRIGVACWPTFGGSGAVATELGLALAERGHEVHFVTYAPPFRLGRLRCNVRFHQVSVSAYPLFRYPPYDLALASKLAEVAEDAHLDLLHVHYAVPHALAAHLARELLGDVPLKTLVTLHGTDITVVGTDPAYRRVTRFGIDRADGVTAVSRWLAAETERVFGTSHSIEVIPNFVDLQRFRPGVDAAVRASLAAPEEALLVHVSNFRPVKRVGDAVRVLAGVARTRPARLVLVGDGPERAAAEKTARALHVQDKVTFLGEQSDIEGLLAAADLFLLPSESESFGLAALEAMACGVPVIGTLTGGLPELVEDGVSGHLCGIGETDCMAKFAANLLTDPVRHAEARRAARAGAERFGREEIVSIYERLYARIIGSTS